MWYGAPASGVMRDEPRLNARESSLRLVCARHVVPLPTRCSLLVTVLISEVQFKETMRVASDLLLRSSGGLTYSLLAIAVSLVFRSALPLLAWHDVWLG